MTSATESYVEPQYCVLDRPGARESKSAVVSWRESARTPLMVLGAVTLAAAAGAYYYFQPELRRYLLMRRM